MVTITHKKPLAPGPRINIVEGREPYAPRPGDQNYSSGNEGKIVPSGGGGGYNPSSPSNFTKVNITPEMSYDTKTKKIVNQNNMPMSKQQIQNQYLKNISQSKKKGSQKTLKTVLEESLIKPAAAGIVSHYKHKQDIEKANARALELELKQDKEVKKALLKSYWGQGRDLSNMQLIQGQFNEDNEFTPETSKLNTFYPFLTNEDLQNYNKFEERYIEPLEKTARPYLREMKRMDVLKAEYEKRVAEHEKAKQEAESRGLVGEERYLHIEPSAQAVNRIIPAYNEQAEKTTSLAKEYQIASNKISLNKQPVITVGGVNPDGTAQQEIIDFYKREDDIWRNKNFDQISKEAVAEQKWMDPEHRTKQYGPEGKVFYQPFWDKNQFLGVNWKGQGERFDNVGRGFRKTAKKQTNFLWDISGPGMLTDAMGYDIQPFRNTGDFRVYGVKNPVAQSAIKGAASNPMLTAGLLSAPGGVGAVARVGAGTMAIGTAGAEGYRQLKRGKNFFDPIYTRNVDIKAREIMMQEIDASIGKSMKKWYDPRTYNLNNLGKRLLNEANMAVVSKNAKNQAYDKVLNYYKKQGMSYQQASHIANKAFKSFHIDAGSEFIELFAGGMGTNKIGQIGVSKSAPFITKFITKNPGKAWILSRISGMAPAGAAEAVYFGGSSIGNRYNRQMTPDEYLKYAAAGAITAPLIQLGIEKGFTKSIKGGDLIVKRKPNFITKKGGNIPTKTEGLFYAFDPMEPISDAGTDLLEAAIRTRTFTNPFTWGKGSSTFMRGMPNTITNPYSNYPTSWGVTNPNLMPMPINQIRPLPTNMLTPYTFNQIYTNPMLATNTNPLTSVQTNTNPYVNVAPAPIVNPYPNVNPNPNPNPNPTILTGGLPGPIPGGGYNWNWLRRRLARFKRINTPYKRLYGTGSSQNSMMNNKFMLKGFY